MSALLEIESVTKIYQVKQNMNNATIALRGVSMTVHTGEFRVINGPSGSGKSTLLHIISGIDSPTDGIVKFDGIPINTLSDDQRTELRRKDIVLIFQSFELIQSLTVYENIEYPLRLLGTSRNLRRDIVYALLKELDIENFSSRFPRELSGGQQQRVGICRALAVSPRILVGDEITANLDSENANRVYEILKQRQKQEGMTVITVSHDETLTKYADKVITLRDGRVV